MSQKIPAFYYIKNNKRRVSVLVVSLAMFLLLHICQCFCYQQHLKHSGQF